jgi:hypothetical protein
MLCPGYRDISELRVRDETDRVARKFNEQKPPRVFSAALSTMNTITDHDVVCCFMSSYILSCPFQDYLPSLYPTYKPDEDDALSAAILTASFATFARRTGHQAYLDRASRSYAIALAYTNAALEDPATAVLDETLASILLMAVFEGTIFPGAQSPEEWTAHLLGAIRLLQLRGLAQFQHDTGRHLYSHIWNNMCASCMQRMVRLPVEFQAWDSKAVSFLGPNYRLRQFSTIMQKAVSFKARLWARLRTDRDILYDLFHDASALEQEAATAMNDAGPEFVYTALPKESTPSWAYNGLAYRYKSHRAAKHQNTIRMVRLFMLEVMSGGALVAIGKLCDQPDETLYYETAIEAAHTLASKISSEILACVPDFLELDSTSTDLRFCSAARTLIWPLNVIVKNKICPMEAREYARVMSENLLKSINRLRLADAGKLITGPEAMDDW